MRIAVVCYPTFGGSGAVATELAIALAERGHEIHVVSYQIPFRLDRWIPNLTFHSVEISDYPLFRHHPYTLNLTNKLIELVDEYGVEMIHSHYAIPHAHAAWMAREVVRDRGQDVRLACTLHGTDITLVGRARGFLEITRFAIAKQDILTTPSACLANETAEHFGIDVNRIAVIPNFVDLDRFKPGGNEQVARCLRKGADPNSVILTHASNMRPVKHVTDVVRAFAVVRKRMPAVLALAGEGPDLPAAEELARELGVREDLRLLGNSERIEDILQVSDLFFLPSNAESFGLAALEAQACGVPVIGYAAGGLPEVVLDGQSGYLCPVGGDACMGTIAANLLEERDRYAAMCQAARVSAERFAPEGIITRYEQALAKA
ncbi:MAG: N-acetyl-alpha-D-glucosaminyl L-malate synthase BshA [Planctomycetota bacterium]|jgi:N-acetyl-alpha-D-glucosaminyl L-malate synthase BshA|nr:N-acetyl-alpha-D-glucosaminyl L-malate synthase BshA [Planctomycetota bacterium]